MTTTATEVHEFPHVIHHLHSPVFSFPMMSQQSSAVLCLATSASVNSFSGTGDMVAKEMVQYKSNPN